ncbi:acyloxyacyl hydrolase [Thermoleptolyngbya sichuanensis XZ-Cy5]|uniref:acyloxyacyl hydrolase n=1 Tax=Thermoleptolyngbya sichuanensis TaxID=2885951 RepID=UPI00240CF8E8|nr:acyloxyacyl hydrolase [Thermoleptolyngbya sichuanensis]MDG2618034.1 acyloxyacyl hydrolase [Thermoleptolyngbya sichuanensis XZ-Cy5]
MPLTSYHAADLLNMEAPLPSELAATADYPPEPDADGRAIAQAEPAAPSAPERFGAVGQNYWYVQAGPSISFDPDDDGFAAFGLAGAGITDFFAHGHSINLELNKLKFIQPGDDAVGLNLGLILRWHFVREDTWSLYVDGGAGFLVTSEDVPAEGGSQFNFTPQVGGGATFRMRDQEHLMVGLRWHHISNAELYPPNPGRDSILLYVGYMWPR